MTYARIVTDIYYNEAAECNDWSLSRDFPSLGAIEDMVEYMGGVSSPNVTVAFLPNVSNSALDDIRNHENYGDGCILLIGSNEGQVPSQTEFDAFRDFMLSKLTIDPPTSSQVDDAIGTFPGSRTRWHISQQLIAWCKNL